jgi:hypothetical protein
MTELYRKWGRSLRREGARVVRVDEAGEAAEDRGVFRTRPIGDSLDLAAPDAQSVDAAAREIQSIVKPPLVIERLFLSEANVAHECNGIRWTETLRRVHVAIARPPIRALLDLADFRFDIVQRIAAALLRAGGEREAPPRIRLAENVGAALLPLLPIAKRQTAAAHDGKGQPVEACKVDSGDAPNWFRPSYRLRPRTAWFHLRAEGVGRVDEGVPQAIALLAPVGEHTIGVLCVDGNRVFPAVVPLRAVSAARSGETWYPYGAGAFGTELML